MLESILVFVFATILGIFTGLMPGFGGLAAMAISYPLLVTLEPHNVLIFYIVLISIDQYYNGLTAIIFGVPGSSYNIPSVIEGHALFKQGMGGETVVYSAISSWICSLFAILFILLLMPFMFYVYKIWTTEAQIIIFMIMFLSLIFVSNNNIFVNATLFFIGIILGQIGYDHTTGTQFLTFDSPILFDGLPIMCVVTALLVVPVLLKSYLNESEPIRWVYLNTAIYKKLFLTIVKSKKLTILRSGVIGSLGGFIPGLSYAASSLIAYSTEKAIQIKNKTYRKGSVNCLIASEGSNNAGALTQLVPLLFLGIPITASEALIYNILEQKGVIISFDWFVSTFWLALSCFILSSTLGLLIAGKYINLLKILNGIKIRTLYIYVLFILLGSLYFMGSQTNSGLEYLFLTICLVPFGILLRNFDTSPLLYGFFLHETIFFTLDRFFVLYNFNINIRIF